MTRIEAGLVLIDADFHSSRFAFNDEERTTPIELGFAWMFRDIETSDSAVHRPRRDRARDRRQDVALEDGRADDRLAGLGSSLRRRRADPAQGRDADRVRDDAVRRRRRARRVHHQLHVLADAATPHRHGAGCARIWPTTGSRVNLEFTINHRYQTVAAQVAAAAAVQPAPKDSLMTDSLMTKPHGQYDAIVIGGGHNGLVNGAYLAKSGLRTLDHRAAAIRRRRGDHRRAAPRLPLHHVLVRPQPAAARHHPRARAGRSTASCRCRCRRRSRRWRTATTCCWAPTAT